MPTYNRFGFYAARIALFFFLALLFVFWNAVWFYPLKIFSVLMHESGHLIATLLSGGSAEELVIKPDESGHVLSSGGWFPLIAASGYIGTALWSFILIWVSRQKKPWIIKTFCFAMMCFLLWIGLVYVPWNQVFTLGVILIYALLFFAFGLRLAPDLSKLALAFLGILTGVYSFQDIRDFLYGFISYTDAGILARYWHFPLLAYPIALFWSSITVYIVGRSLKILLPRPEA